MDGWMDGYKRTHVHLEFCLPLSAAPNCTGWDVRMMSTRPESLVITWHNRTIDQALQEDFFLVSVENSRFWNGERYAVLSSERRSVEFGNLRTLTEYNVSFIAVDKNGVPCRVTSTRRTDESGERHSE